MDKQSLADEVEETVLLSAAPEAEESFRELIRTQEVMEVAEIETTLPPSEDLEKTVLDPVAECSKSENEPQLIHHNHALLANTISKLKKNERNIFAISAGLAALFTVKFGGLAAVTILFWISISLLLTRLNFLSSSYEALCDDTGLLFRRKDKLGRSTLRIAWARVHHIEERSGKLGRELKVQMKAMKFPFVFKCAFQDLFDYQLFSERVTVCSEDFSSSEFYNGLVSQLATRTAALSIPFNKFAEPLANESTKEAELTQGVESSDKNLSSSDNLTVDSKDYEADLESDEKIVAYNPHRALQDSVVKVLKRYEIALVALLIVVAVGALVFQGLLYAKMLVFFLIGLTAWSCLNPFTNERAQFSLNKDGLAVFWENAFRFGKRKKISSSSPRVPWQCVKRVYVRTAKVNSPGTLIMVLDAASQATRHLRVLRFLAPKLIVLNGTAIELRIRIDGLPGEKSRRNLYEGLFANLADEVIDPSVKECLNPTDVASYTKLWMDSFSTASSRRFEGSLPDGHHLRNGEYEIQSFLGAGGQASVYLAKSQSEQFATTVVLKEFILPAHAGADVSQRSLANIQREFDLMQKLEHANIVRYHDLFVEDHRAYLVLEHVDGPSLRTLVDEQGALPENKVLELAESMARILQHLHNQNPCIIHRDFTPENLILGKDGVLKLIDFNVAQELETEATRTIVGKHSYLPPEQFRGKATPQSDIYAFGASLYFLLTGIEPEPITCSHPILHNDAITGACDSLVSDSTALELDIRIQCASELIERVQSLQNNEE